MPRPPRVTREEILATARAHFVKGGHGVSITAIARDVGLSHSALIQRFGSKRALLIESLRPPVDFEWGQYLLSEPPQNREETITQLTEIGGALIEFLSARMPEIMVLVSAGVKPTEIFPGHLPFPLVACQKIAAWIQVGVDREVFRPCDPHAVASIIVGTFFSRPRLAHVCQMYYAQNRRDHHEPEVSTIGSLESVIETITLMLFK